MQNMVPPATIKRTLMGTWTGKVRRVPPAACTDRALRAGAGPTADAGGAALVRYLALHSAAEFVVFIRNLTAYLEDRPAVSRPLSPRI